MNRSRPLFFCCLILAMIPAVFCAAQSDGQDETSFDYGQEQDYSGETEAEAVPEGNGPEAAGAPIRVTVIVNGQEQTLEFQAAPHSTGSQAESGARRPSPPPSPPRRNAQKPQPPAPPPPGQPLPVKVTPRLPDPHSGRVYRLQVGAFANPVFARRAFDRLRSAGLRPAYERHSQYYRVVVSGVRAAEMARVISRIGSAGFSEAWLREER